MNDIERALTEHIALLVRIGFDSRQTIIDSAIELFRDDYDMSELRAVAPRITDDLMAAHVAVQKFWSHETDCDKLDEAFAELDRLGIVARQNFTCCQTCGHTEIQDEISDTLILRPVIGYTFYHQQDAARAAEGDKLYLAYGSVDGNEADSLSIAHEVVRVLKTHGLHVEWNGQIHKRICIAEFYWERRYLPSYLTESE